MARTRLIKPEFFRSEDVGMLPPMARLLFAGLWTLADKDGRLLDRPRRIAADLFPYDDEPDVDANLSALAARGLILRYVVTGLACIQITGFAKHQVPHYKEPSLGLPAPVAVDVGQSPGKPGFVTAKPGETATSRPYPDPDPDPVSDPDPEIPPSARSDDQGTDAQAPPPVGLWDAFDWSTKFKLAWCAKYNTHAYGQGTKDAKATGDLLGILGELTPGDRLAAQDRAGAMFAEYLADPVPGRGTNRHPWIWFVERFNGLRVPAQAARGSPGKPPPRTDADRRKNALPPPPKEWTDGWTKNQQT